MCIISERKRFYKQVYVYQKTETDIGSLYGVRLDHRDLKTPLKNLFLVPSEKLAIAVAQEWEDQEEYIETHYMHLTHLCNTAIDKPVFKTASDQITSILPFLDTDVLRCVSLDSEDLAHQQQQEWEPQITWFNSRFGTTVSTSADLLPQPISEADCSKVIVYLEQLNDWSLTSFAYGVESSKSLILTTAMFEDHITSSKAAELSLLETLFQARRWGKVEWSHDMDFKDLCCKLSAAKLLKLLT